MNLMTLGAAVLLGLWVLEIVLFVLGYKTLSRRDKAQTVEPLR